MKKVSAPSKTFEKRVRHKGEDHPFKAHSGVDFEFEIHHLSKSLSQGLGPPFMLPTPPKETKQSDFVCFHVFMPVVSTKRGASELRFAPRQVCYANIEQRERRTELPYFKSAFAPEQMLKVYTLI